VPWWDGASTFVKEKERMKEKEKERERERERGTKERENLFFTKDCRMS
jgi:hypothetical protein